jgi:tetratricopeptide (TPR) repeat protein
MDQERENPYNFTRPVTDPEMFAGRQRELDQIEYCLDLSTNRRPIFMNLALIGQRASGKTSLLNRVQFMAEQKNFLTVKIKLDNSIVSSEVNFFYELYYGLMTTGCQKGMYDGLHSQTYLTFRAVMDLLTLDVDMAHMPLMFPNAYVGSRQRQIPDLPISQHVLVHDFEKLRQEAQSRGMRTIVLLFDECDLFSTNETLLQKLRNLLDEVEGYILIFAGTERMFPKLQEVFSPIPRQFKKIPVEKFRSIREIMECVYKPLLHDEKGLVSFETIRDLHRLSGGSPYEVQLVCHGMYHRYESGDAEKLAISRDVLDNVYAELDRLRDKSRKSVIPIIKQLSRAELQFLNKILPYQMLTLDQSITYQEAKDILLGRSDVSVGQLDRSESWNMLQACAEKGLAELDADTGQITFCGDEFDRFYMKYHIRSVYPELEWQWRDESLVELIAELLADYLKPVLSPLAYHIDDFPEALGENRSIQQLYDDMLSLSLEDTTHQDEQLKGLTMEALRSAPILPHIFVQEAIFQREEVPRRRVLGAVVEVMRRGETTRNYHFFSLRPDVSADSAVEVLQSRTSSGNERLRPFEIQIKLGETKLIESGEVMSVDDFKALAASADEGDTEFLQGLVRAAGVVFYHDDYLAEAFETFELAIDMWPEWGLAYNNAGFILLEACDDEQAETYLYQALEREYEDSHITHLDLGYIYFRRGELEKALNHFQRAKQICIENPLEEPNAVLRVGYYPEEFCSVLDLRVQRAPDDIKAIFAACANLCAVYLALGRISEALAICEEGLELDPKDRYVLLAKASALYHSGDSHSALKTLETVADLAPDDARIKQLMDIVRKGL